MANETKETTKEILDTIEETLDVMDETITVIEKHKKVILPVAIAAGVAGLALGAVGGYIFAKRRLETKYNAISDHEIAEAKRFYAKTNKTEEFSTPEKALETLHGRGNPKLEEAAEALLMYKGQGSDEDVPAEPEVNVTVNVFEAAETKDDFDLEEEKKTRVSHRPYIISHEEFMVDEPEFPQESLTYYAGDEVLADDNDEAIPIPDDIVGLESLKRFGHGSNDSRVVYVRNERLRLDFEIALSDGKFSHEVLGLQHADERYERKPSIRKFRGGDE